MDADKNVASEMVVMPIFEEYVKNGWSIDHFEGADEVHPEKHFEIQAALQKHVDNSISKTVNIPQGTYTTELLSALYIKYLPQLKGVTIYPEGSRDFTPLERISNQDGADFVIQKVATARLEDTCLSGTCGL
jgi:ribonucleoside-diphosphate reductase alpha chain